MNIAILGGAFNPPHFGHLSIARQVLDFCPVEQVWLMPTYIYNPLFPKNHNCLAEYKHRLAMTRLLEDVNIKVSDFESKIPGPSYTLAVLSFLQKNYPNSSFSFIIGSDQVVLFRKWYKYRDLLSKYKVYVFPRENMNARIYPGMEMISSPFLRLVDISSTQVRNDLKNSCLKAGQLPRPVLEYIACRGLYQ